MIHEIDILRYWLGDITRVYVEESSIKTRPFGVEETASMTLRFATGAVGTFLLTEWAILPYSADEHSRSNHKCSAGLSPYGWESATGENPLIPRVGQNAYTIVGTKGSISVPELKRWHLDGDEAPSWNAVLRQDTSASDAVDPERDPIGLQLAHFVEVLRGKAKPACSAADGTAALKVLEAMVKSMETRQPVDV